MAAIKAVTAAFLNDDFPEGLAIKVELLPVIFPLHMVTGALALLALLLVGVGLLYALFDPND